MSEEKPLGADAAVVEGAGSIAPDAASHAAPKHTPGPWGFTYDGSGDYSIGPAHDPQVDRVAVVSERRAAHADWEEATANATLIAAAPEMYEALKGFVGLLKSTGPRLLSAYTELLADAEAAIAKAEGK